jgi:hypothetical protein
MVELCWIRAREGEVFMKLANPVVLANPVTQKAASAALAAGETVTMPLATHEELLTLIAFLQIPEIRKRYDEFKTQRAAPAVPPLPTIAAYMQYKGHEESHLSSYSPTPNGLTGATLSGAVAGGSLGAIAGVLHGSGIPAVAALSVFAAFAGGALTSLAAGGLVTPKLGLSTSGELSLELSR